MNKKSRSDTSPKEKKSKRLKTHRGKTNTLSFIRANTDCYRLEEQECVENIYELFLDTCQKIRNYTLLLYNTKKGKENQPSKLQIRMHICVLIMRLKKLNRLDKHKWKKSRDLTNERKQSVDALNLQYQNLLYEATHLQKEVMKCEQFRSLDEEIDLVPVEDFYRDAPKEISKPEITKTNIHEQTMARLFWEMEQRKTLEVDLKEADILKQTLKKEIKDLEDKLSSIHPILKAIVVAAEPFASKMGMPFQAMQLNYNVAKYLPNPLYVLYAQSCAYQAHSKGNWLNIAIEGAVDDAKALLAKSDELYEDSGESDTEDKDSQEINARRQSLSKLKQTKKIDLLTSHPMSVVITVDKDLKIELEFRFLTYLNIVTVKIRSLTPEPMTNEFIGDLLRQDTILHYLTPDDVGKETPNLTNVHILNSHFSDPVFSNETTGWPYVWAQKMAGLTFLASDNSRHTYVSIPMNVKRTMSLIATRLVSRHQLYQQITSIDQKLKVPLSFMALYPPNVPSEIKNWCPVPWKDINMHKKFSELKELGIANEYCLYYYTDIHRGTAVLSSYIMIPPDYPIATPVFVINLNWGGEQTGISNFVIRELEEEVNVHLVQNLSPEHKPYLLVCQLYHLQVCMDVFLEVECYGDNRAGPPEFTREKVIVRYFRGLGRSRPYKCASTQGIFTFR